MFFYLFIPGCRGLCRHAWALVVVCRFHCSAFSCCEAWALGHVGFSSCGSGSVVVVHGLGCPIACGIFMDQGLNPCLLILASEFLTTGSPGKSQRFFLSMSHQEAELRSGTLALLWIIPPLNRYRNVCNCVGLLDTLVLPDSMVWCSEQINNSWQDTSFNLPSVVVCVKNSKYVKILSRCFRFKYKTQVGSRFRSF